MPSVLSAIEVITPLWARILATILSVRHPWFCILCLHNQGLHAADRIAVCNEAIGKAYDLQKKSHVEKHSIDLIEDQRYPCRALQRLSVHQMTCTHTGTRKTPNTWAWHLSGRRTCYGKAEAETCSPSRKGKERPDAERVSAERAEKNSRGILVDKDVNTSLWACLWEVYRSKGPLHGGDFFR